ncbi:MAG: chaperone NapD [Thiotrichaceae bacterium]|nr:chaperone NapD [Thiotrichaceae bacterium]
MTMAISGVLVHADNAQINHVQQQLSQINGVDIHTTTDDGRIIVTLESDDGYNMADTMAAFNQIPGVYSTAMVYQYSDDDLDEQETQEGMTL